LEKSLTFQNGEKRALKDLLTGKEAVEHEFTFQKDGFKIKVGANLVKTYTFSAGKVDVRYDHAKSGSFSTSWTR